MGGRVHVQSTQGVGSRFIVEVPLKSKDLEFEDSEIAPEERQGLLNQYEFYKYTENFD